MAMFTMKFIVVILALVHSAFVLLWVTAGTLTYIRDYYGPSLKFPHLKGKGFLGECGPSTEDFQDLVVQKSHTKEEAEEIAQTHGIAVVESVLTKETAKNLRNHILEENHRVESAYVHHPDNRFHIMPRHDEPSVQDALKEIAEHPILRPLLDNLLGPSSSLVAFSVITNLYGAEDQNWHWDTGTSTAVYPDYFVPEYTLAIPLQRTTTGMGATGICPGTQMCEYPAFNWEELEDFYNENFDEYFYDYPDFDNWMEYNMPCELTAEGEAGDGMLYNADIYHRGAGHYDPDAPERVVAFLTFAGSRQGPHDKRSLPLGTVHTLRWNNWGHTIDDFSTMKEHPWRIWHAFGLFRPRNKNGARPWNLLDDILLIFKDDEENSHVIANDFNAEAFSAIVSAVLAYTGVATGVYMTLVPFFMLALILLLISRTNSEKSY